MASAQSRLALILAGLCLGGQAWAICSGGPPRRPPPSRPGYPVGSPGYPVGPDQRYQVAEYEIWWGINRDEILLSLKTVEDPLARYERKAPPPDTVEALLPLVGYEGDFCAIVKEIALRRLKRVPKVDEALAGVLKNARASAPERAWAAYALGDLKCRGAIPALKEGLKERDETLRGFCALALGKMDDAQAYEAILPLALAPGEGEDVRCLAILSLARSTAPGIRQALSGLARDGKGAGLSVRRSAVLALGVGTAPGEAALLAGLASDRNPNLRSVAGMALGLSGKSPEVVAGLLGDNDVSVRCYAALALGLHGGEGSVPALLQALEKDRDPSVRGCAALALGRSRDPRAVQALAKACANRSYSFLANYAAIALGLSGSPEALGPLTEGLKSKQFDHLTSCAAGLAILGCPEAEKPVLEALENRNHPIVREYAAIALGHLKQPASFERLLACMQDKAFEVRHATALALAIYGDRKACPVLDKALGDPHESVRTTAALAFDLLTDDPARALTLGAQFKADPRNQISRKVGLAEINRLFNSYTPENYRLPVTP